MSENETTTPKSNRGLWNLLRLLVATAFCVVMLVLTIRSCRHNRQMEERHQRWEREFQEKHYPSFERAKARLQALAEHGCEVTFKDCLRPSVVKQYVYDAMDREKIAFGTHGVTQVELDELETQAEVMIASQKLAHLKAKGGAKLPSDIKLLNEVCAQIYIYERKLLPSNPTSQELQQLLPSGVTKVEFCRWGEER